MVSVAYRINAAFGVSNKFVPYRPNWDLVVNRITGIERYIQEGIVEFATYGATIRSFAIRRKSGTTNSRILLKIFMPVQQATVIPYEITTTLSLAGESNNTPVIGHSAYIAYAGVLNGTDPPIPKMYYKVDTANQVCYISINHGISNPWSNGIIECLQLPKDQVVIDVKYNTDISSDPAAVKVDLYAPTLTLLT